MTQVKICGLTRVEDVELASALGAAYLGFNFSAASPRRLGLANARTLAAAAGPSARKVGVFVGERAEQIREAIDAAGLDLVQLHRPLTESDLDLPRPVIALGRVRRDGAFLPDASLLSRCRFLLFDSGSPEHPGGTGWTLDWSALSSKSWPAPVMLAGGLTPGNVADAIARVRPAAVDVASGVEASPGVKDPGKLRSFFDAVSEADERR